MQWLKETFPTTTITTTTCITIRSPATLLQLPHYQSNQIILPREENLLSSGMAWSPHKVPWKHCVGAMLFTMLGVTRFLIANSADTQPATIFFCVLSLTLFVLPYSDINNKWPGQISCKDLNSTEITVTHPSADIACRLPRGN